jgi:hypothetical protein
MSDTSSPSPDKKVYKALPIVADVEFMSGISKKSGNEYLIGHVNIKSPISDTPIRLGFEYIDPNTRELIKLSLDKFLTEQTEEFAEDIKG